MDSCPTLEFKVSELFFALFIVGHSPNSLGHPKNILWILLDTWGQKCNYIKTLRITSFMCSEKIINIKVGVSLSPRLYSTLSHLLLSILFQREYMY